ncbi:hypothetical protein SAY87_024517 [Trapa incisa]|uniref:Uncharacterized protein n=1 Tax=Trapa incisa TaxID=236973 RepID=A0AAN7GG12_9MYRT|nr:hypothetical protein SAY87_024517 [Trapa incisa]
MKEGFLHMSFWVVRNPQKKMLHQEATKSSLFLLGTSTTDLFHILHLHTHRAPSPSYMISTHLAIRIHNKHDRGKDIIAYVQYETIFSWIILLLLASTMK